MHQDYLSFEALGTHWCVDIHGSVSSSTKTHLSESIQQRIAEFEQAYSRFRSDSLLNTISQQPGRYVLPPDAQKMLDLYWQLYTLTKGC